MANRSYIKTTGLRSTVAWAMASLAQIQVITHTAAVFVLVCTFMTSENYEGTTLLYLLYANQKALDILLITLKGKSGLD